MQGLRKAYLSLDQQAQLEEEKDFCDKTFRFQTLLVGLVEDPTSPYVVTVFSKEKIPICCWTSGELVLLYVSDHRDLLGANAGNIASIQ